MDDVAHRYQLKHRCFLCQMRLESSNELLHHLKRNHQGENRFKCDYCEKSFKSNANLKIHTMNHTGEKPFPCDVCDKRFKTKYTAKLHMTIHAGKKDFKCDQCGHRFINKFRLHAHWVYHKAKRHKCNKCDKRFALVTDLRKHMLSHSEERRYKCEQCDKCYKMKTTLNKHIFSIHGDLEGNYKCNKCNNKWYKSMKALNKHGNRVHKRNESKDSSSESGDRELGDSGHFDAFNLDNDQFLFSHYPHQLEEPTAVDESIKHDKGEEARRGSSRECALDPTSMVSVVMAGKVKSYNSNQSEHHPMGPFKKHRIKKNIAISNSADCSSENDTDHNNTNLKQRLDRLAKPSKEKNNIFDDKENSRKERNGPFEKMKFSR